MRKVRTLNKEEFFQSCKRLEEKIINSLFCPDIIIGIASGGVFVLDNIFDDVNNKIIISLKRDGIDQRTKKYIKFFISNLPIKISNFLRNLEAFYRSRLSKNLPIDNELVASIKKTIIINCKDLKEKKILIVDDAIDSGRTLSTVLKAAKQVFSKENNCEIRAAVLVATEKNSIIEPDYKVFSDILIRFPWSIDSVENNF